MIPPCITYGNIKEGVQVSKKEGQPDFLDFENPIIRENAPSVTLVSVFPKVKNKFSIKKIKDPSVLFLPT